MFSVVIGGLGGSAVGSFFSSVDCSSRLTSLNTPLSKRQLDYPEMMELMEILRNYIIDPKSVHLLDDESFPAGLELSSDSSVEEAPQVFDVVVVEDEPKEPAVAAKPKFGDVIRKMEEREAERKRDKLTPEQIEAMLERRRSRDNYRSRINHVAKQDKDPELLGQNSAHEEVSDNWASRASTKQQQSNSSTKPQRTNQWGDPIDDDEKN
jgi:hypothetical protein